MILLNLGNGLQVKLASRTLGATTRNFTTNARGATATPTLPLPVSTLINHVYLFNSLTLKMNYVNKYIKILTIELQTL